MNTLLASEARRRLFKLIDEVAEGHVPTKVTSKRNSIVMVAADDWRSIEETLYLHSIPGMVDSIKKASASSLDECYSLDDLKIDLNEV